MRLSRIQCGARTLPVSVTALLAIVEIAFAGSICSNEPTALVPDGCATYGSLEDINRRVQPLVQDITHGTDYFSYYRLDLYGRTCPFWSDDEGMCANIACSVNTIDNEEDIPPVWRAGELGKLTGPKAKHPSSHEATEPSPLGGALGENTAESCVVEEDACDERDYCVPEDESFGSNGDYVSLIENPERFTGYAGAGSENVWKSIYRENCFSKPSNGHTASHSPAAQSFINVMHDKLTHEIEKDAVGKPTLLDVEVDDECLEKRVFYRVISGMHASISMHLCWDYLNQTTGEWSPNLDCFIKRFEGYPERIQNIYFNYALLLRAVAKLRNYIPQYTFCTADPMQNRLTKAKVLKLAGVVPTDAVFDEGVMFREDAAVLKEDFRNRFRNVSRVMDCVGCDKCRLWGKVQVQGYGTALKILFEFDENADVSENPPLRRTELVALINTLGRVSHSLSVLPKFQKLWEAHNRTIAAENEHPPRERKEDGDPEPTVREIFWEEWDAVWSTFFFVIRSWVALPKIFFNLAVQEATILWDRLHGRPPDEFYYKWRSGPSVEAKSEL